MTKDEAQFRIRMPSELKAWLEDQALRNGRSMNAELNWMLQFMRDGYQKEIQSREAEMAEIKKIALEALERAKDAQGRVGK
ncbi:Arc family DNA-binding protein [Gluconobacter oxydans]|uniref:Arc family DNA-binding protein n=1 Tax=Gluconobacter oxydans TaxID=442 RepID=UPI000797E76E|nr:Arc family DNA-binding protein [Gluconobacter oxydans]KXV13935.1 hypothetical protein AD932_03330 [Gluconobacter oxydans]